MDVVTLSRLQFGLTAMYHFLFVPLTLGLSVLLAVMESIYVTTGRTIWRDMVKFGARCLALTSRWVSRPVLPWSFSSERTGRIIPIT